MGDPPIHEYLRQAADAAPVVGSVCTGALILAAAGLLEGRQATTHWAYHRLLERLGATYFAAAAGLACDPPRRRRDHPAEDRRPPPVAVVTFGLNRT